jgi:hypothetical protein
MEVTASRFAEVNELRGNKEDLHNQVADLQEADTTFRTEAKKSIASLRAQVKSAEQLHAAAQETIQENLRNLSEAMQGLREADTTSNEQKVSPRTTPECHYAFA